MFGSLDDQRIQVDNENYHLNVQSGQTEWCKRVTLQHDITVPARSEMDLPTKVICRPWKESPTDLEWGTENAKISGVYVSRTLLPRERLSDVPVRVINVKCEPVHLLAGTVIANVQAVTVMDEERAEDETTVKVRQVTQKDDVGENTLDFVEKLIEDVHCSSPESTVLALRSLLTKYQDVFSTLELDLGVTTLVKHHINTNNAPPFRQPIRRFPPAHAVAISEHVDSLLSQGVIEPACSPYASNLVLVRKKDGSYRCCVDYRMLNTTTRKDAYPLPRIVVCLDAMATAKWFSTFDPRSSYHQVQVDPQDMDKTAFVCPRGHYRFRMMPFGLCNAGATFQRLMDIVMSGLNMNVCLVYWDDIICFSTTIVKSISWHCIIFRRQRSFIGSNVFFCCERYWSMIEFINNSSEFNNFPFNSLFYDSLTEMQKNSASFLFELLSIREGYIFLPQSFLSYVQLSDIIDFISTV